MKKTIYHLEESGKLKLSVSFHKTLCKDIAIKICVIDPGHLPSPNIFDEYSHPSNEKWDFEERECHYLEWIEPTAEKASKWVDEQLTHIDKKYFRWLDCIIPANYTVEI